MKVSVVTAVYNNVSEIETAITSVLSQRGVDVELVVVDGGSTDGTRDVLERFRVHFGAYVSARDGGIYPALNRGLSLATGNYVGFLHSDDLFASENALATLFGNLGSARPDAIWGDLDYVRKTDPTTVVRHWKSTPFTTQRLRHGWMPPHPSLYVRRDRFLALGGFDQTMKIAADYDFILRLFGSGGDFQYCAGTIVKMRTGGASNRSLNAIIQKSREDIMAMRRAGISVIPAIIAKNLSKISQLLPWRHHT